MELEERDCIVFDCAWHPSGKFICTVGSDGAIKVFKDEGCQWKCVFEEVRTRTVRRCEFSPDGTKLAVCGFDSVGLVYKVDPFELIGTLDGQQNELKSIRWSHDGQRLATCSRDKTIWVWDSDYEFTAVLNEHTADVKDVQFSHDDRLLVSSSFDGTMRIWDPSEEFGSLQCFNEHEGTVWSAAFSDDDNCIVSIGEDGKAVLYTKENDQYEIASSMQLQKEHQPLFSVVYSNEKWMITGSERKLFVLDTYFTEVIATVELDHIGDVNSAKPMPGNDSVICTCSDDGTTKIINI